MLRHPRFAALLLACSMAAGLTLTPSSTLSQPVVSIPSISVEAGSTVDVHVMAGDLSGLGISSFRIWVRFDTKLLEFVSSPICSDAVNYPWDTFKLASQVGDEVHVAAATSESFSGAGCLFDMRFQVAQNAPAGRFEEIATAAPGSCSPLEIVVGDMLPVRPVSFFDGQVCIGPAAQVSLTPLTESPLVGEQHTVTAKLEIGGSPSRGKTVDFEVISGPNAGLTGTGITNDQGEADFGYTSGGRGVDLIRAQVPVQEGSVNPLWSTVVAATWLRTPTDTGEARTNPTVLSVVPNPSFERAEIRYTPRRLALSTLGSSWIEIFDARGRRVRRAPLALSGPGTLAYDWDGRDGTQQRVPAGIYMLRVHVPGETVSAKILRVRPRD